MPALFDTSALVAGHHVLQKRFEIPPPGYQTRNETNPTLIVSWFCTILSLVTIVIRLLGRWVRNERLFIDDKIMFWSIIPLLGRMAFVHVVLIWGTNNTVLDGLTDIQIQHRIIGSKLVLPARIFFATFIWITKITVLEFLKKVVSSSMHKSYEIGMRVVYGFLGLTYVGVVISTFTECHPFSNYWQVIPDPGVACRATPVQLITMGVCEIATDLMLVILPIPLVLMSGMTLKRKLSLLSLFFLSAIPIAVTAYRLPTTLQRNNSQTYRSLMASLQVLATTAVANAIVIGSFLRDRGVKKAKFRAGSVDESMVSRVMTAQSRSKSITQHHWGSDEDLVRDMGMALARDLRSGSIAADTSTRLAPVAEVLPTHFESEDTRSKHLTVNTNWGFNQSRRVDRRRADSDVSSISSSASDIKLRELHSIEEPISPTAERQRKLSFFETGQTLDSRYVSSHAPPDLDTSRSLAFLSDVGGLLNRQSKEEDGVEVIASETQHPQRKDSLHPHDPRRLLRGGSSFRRGSSSERNELPQPRKPSRSPNRTTGPNDMDLADAGGLLK